MKKKEAKLNSEMIWNKWKISVLVNITAKESSFSSSLTPPTPAEAAIHTYPRAAAAEVISLKFHPKHLQTKTKRSTL
jgi:hypothetical protein